MSGRDRDREIAFLSAAAPQVFHPSSSLSAPELVTTQHFTSRRDAAAQDEMSGRDRDREIAFLSAAAPRSSIPPHLFLRRSWLPLSTSRAGEMQQLKME